MHFTQNHHEILTASKQDKATLIMESTVVIKGPSDKALDTSESPYIHAATSENTRAAYQADIQHFLKSGGTLPASPDDLERYLKDSAPQYNTRTLIRRVTALRQWHKLQGVDDPTQHPRVTKTLRGIARLHGRPKKQAAALRLSDLDTIIASFTEPDTLMSARNRALLLVGFFGAFRRSELVSLTWEHIQFVSDGMIITLPRSKTDQTGEGAPCIIPFGNDARCPVRALIHWREVSGQWAGGIFRRITKAGQVRAEAIGPRYWNRLIRELALAAGLPNAEQISSHSLRRGFATEAARLGASMPAIQRHGRWRSTKTVVEYIEAGRQFADSAVNVLFDFA